jgi:hypothetical protein
VIRSGICIGGLLGSRLPQQKARPGRRALDADQTRPKRRLHAEIAAQSSDAAAVHRLAAQEQPNAAAGHCFATLLRLPSRPLDVHQFAAARIRLGFADGSSGGRAS